MACETKGTDMNKELKIAVIGAGAIGGITAAFLKKAGYDVEIVCKYEDRAAKIKDEGIHITGVRGEHYIKMDAVAEVEQMNGKKDIIFVVTKAYDMPDAAGRALPFLKSNTVVVAVQNGLCIDEMASIAGPERTIGCVVGWAATMLEGAVLHMKSEGEFVIGGAQKGNDVSLIQEVLSEVMPTRVSKDILSDLYSKMIINSCITAMGVLSGLYLGQMLKKRSYRNIFIAIIKEAIDVANSMGLKVLPYGGMLDYYSLVSGDGMMARLKRHFIIRLLGIKYRNIKSSSLEALKRGKPTEVDYYNGYIARKGEELGVPTPVNTRVVQMIKEIEAGTRRTDPVNFRDDGLKAG